jgi:hypothetical protein
MIKWRRNNTLTNRIVSKAVTNPISTIKSNIASISIRMNRFSIDANGEPVIVGRNPRI